ncbi:MAG TPA: hypothetical protein VFX40_05860 [Gemmatimonadaceae bacterium]|nr:hypothetical protein [Gemmatimonadaceae bacterium]
MIDGRTLAAAVMLSFFSAATLQAQSVLLQIRPRVGDTLSIRLDQKVEMTGVPPGCATGYAGAKKKAVRDGEPPGCAGSTRQMTSVMELFSKAIVQRSTPSGSHVLAVTDSLRTATSSGAARAARPRRVPSTAGTVELRISTDGGAEVVDADATPELRAIFGQMPATLSRKAVAVGETWIRQMRVPIATEAGATSMVRATFRLDSIGNNGDIAFISMKGTLSHDHTDGSDSELDGWLTGTMQLDRRLAWITDSRAIIDVESTVKGAAGGQPMRVRTRITQTLKARPAQ